MAKIKSYNNNNFNWIVKERKCPETLVYKSQKKIIFTRCMMIRTLICGYNVHLVYKRKCTKMYLGAGDVKFFSLQTFEGQEKRMIYYALNMSFPRIFCILKLYLKFMT